jgi:hypothetical protein
MLRRSVLGALAFSALSLATVASAGATAEVATPAVPAQTVAISAQAAGADDCGTCQIIVDVCEFRLQCEPLPMGIVPPGLGLHPTVIHANIFNFFPDGPLACLRRPWTGPALCLPFAALGMGNPMVAPGMRPGGPGMSPGGPGTGPGGPGTGPSTPMAPPSR